METRNKSKQIPEETPEEQQGQEQNRGDGPSTSGGDQDPINRMMKLMEQYFNKIQENRKEDNEKNDQKFDKLQEKLEQNDQKLDKIQEKNEQNFNTLQANLKEEISQNLNKVQEVIEEKIQALKQVFTEELKVTKEVLEGKIQENKREIVEIKEVLENEKQNNKRQFEEVEEKLAAQHVFCLSEMDRKEDEMRKDVHDQVKQDKREMKDELNLHKQSVEGKMNEMSTKITREKKKETCHGIVVDSKISFNGNIKKQHPVPFIKYLRNKAVNYVDFEDFKEFLRNQVYDEALLWFTNKENELHEFEDFAKKFLAYFWGTAQQKTVKKELLCGKYNPNKGSSYHRYAMQIYSVSQYLDCNFSEEYIVSLIVQHFDQTLEEIMLLYNFKEIDALCQFLLTKERRKDRNTNNGQNFNRYNYDNQGQNNNNDQQNQQFSNNNNFRQNQQNYNNNQNNSNNQNNNSNNQDNNNQNFRRYNNNNRYNNYNNQNRPNYNNQYRNYNNYNNNQRYNNNRNYNNNGQQNSNNYINRNYNNNNNNGYNNGQQYQNNNVQQNDNTNHQSRPPNRYNSQQQRSRSVEDQQRQCNNILRQYSSQEEIRGNDSPQDPDSQDFGNGTY